jgi:hypothetical protein
MFELVVARFDEDLSWISDIHFNYKVYNKGKPINLPCICLPNVGREAKTFLYHIIENYDKLSEYTVFLQGNPFDHCKDLLEILGDLPSALDQLAFFSEGCYSLCHRNLCESQDNLAKYKVFPEDFHNAFFKVPLKKFRYASGAQYIVHRQNILNKPLKFYQRMHDALMWDTHEPWSIERIWPVIFERNDKYQHKII